MKKNLCIYNKCIVILLLFLSSCNKEESSKPLTGNSTSSLPGQQIVINEARSFGLSHMANEFLSSGLIKSKDELKANKLYIKIIIQHPEDFKKLSDANILYLQHPINELLKNELPSKEMRKQVYAVIDASSKLPDGIRFEVLKQLYIPEKTNNTMATSNQRVTQTANSSNFWWWNGTPVAGKIRVRDPLTQAYEPLKNIRVIGIDGWNVREAQTDNSGNFALPSNNFTGSEQIYISFSGPNTDAEIRLVSQSNGLFSLLSQYNLTVGTYQYGLSNIALDINENSNGYSQLYNPALAWNVKTKLFEFSQANNILKPQHKMMFWITEYPVPLSNTVSMVAPNLQQLLNDNAGYGNQILKDFFDKLSCGVTGQLGFDYSGIIDAIKPYVPDVVIPVNTDHHIQNITSSGTNNIYMRELYHEISHTIHYRQAGALYWKDLTDKFLSNFLRWTVPVFTTYRYGCCYDTNHTLPQLSEAWAEDYSIYVMGSLYNNAAFNTYNEFNLHTGSCYYQSWIPYGLFYDLYDSDTDTYSPHSPYIVQDNVNSITFSQMYTALNGARDFNTFLSNLALNTSTHQKVETMINNATACPSININIPCTICPN